MSPYLPGPWFVVSKHCLKLVAKETFVRTKVDSVRSLTGCFTKVVHIMHDKSRCSNCSCTHHAQHEKCMTCSTDRINNPAFYSSYTLAALHTTHNTDFSNREHRDCYECRGTEGAQHPLFMTFKYTTENKQQFPPSRCT